MNNPLLRAGAIVFATWWVVLTLWSLGDPSHFTASHVSSSLNKLAVVFLAILLGLAYPVVFLIRRRRTRLELLAGTTHRGLQITIGPTPRGLLPPERIPNSVFTPDAGHPLGTWLDRIRTERPDLHAVFAALTDIYAANLELPAAPVRYGHGGRSLFEHTMVVVDMIMEKAKDFSFDGSYSKSGKKTTGLLDPHYVFDRDDLLIPLIAYAHDVGKIDAYQLQADGRVKELMPDHDRPGRLLLARLHEVWALPKEDREALLSAVGYYHHPHALPRHIDDRSRALMELLLEADLAAGEWEGKHPLNTGEPVTPGVTPRQMESHTRAGDDARETPRIEPLVPSSIAGQDPEFTGKQHADAIASSGVPAATLTEMEQGLLHQLIDVLAIPDSINGKRRQFRIGYKYEDFVYLKEASLCKAIAEAMGEPKLASPAARKGDNRSQLTEDIMRSLDKLGLLLVEHDGKTYSYKTALFTVDWYDHRAFRPDPPKPVSELILETDPATVILLIKGPLAHLAKLPDCRLIPRIVRPLMGTHKALNKARTPTEPSVPAEPNSVPPEEIIDKEPETRVDSDGRVPPITKEVEIAPPIEFERSPVTSTPDQASAASPVAETPRASATQRGQDTESGDRFDSRYSPAPLAPTSSQGTRAATGLKRRSDSSRRRPEEEVDVLSSILSLQAAAEERAASKKRVPSPSPSLGTPEHASQEHASPSDQSEPPISIPEAGLASVETDTALALPGSDPPTSAASLPAPEPAQPDVASSTGARARPRGEEASEEGSDKERRLSQVHRAVSELGLSTQSQSNSRGEQFLSCAITPELSDRLAEIMSEIAIRPRKDIRVLTDRNTGARYLVFETTS